MNKIMGRYQFLGKPDEVFPHLVTGKVYLLFIEEYSKGLLGWLVGNTFPVIVRPIRCPYRSWDTFFANWKEVSINFESIIND